MQVMSLYLRHVKANVHDRLFFTNSPLYAVRKGQIYPVNDSPIHGKHNGENYRPVHESVYKLQPF